ncbi:MAG TPA: preprotein translocase subunit SecY [Dehalococcoidia bacterium]|nr:preprotein translocase subunit SecY [Dehalococcoidia bacterium]
MMQAVLNALQLPDVRRKLIFTFTILIIFRFIAHVPVPGVDLEQLRQLFQSNQLLGMLDLFSGGAMRNFSVATMGVYPYITASIIMQLLIPVIPQLEAMQKEGGEQGRKRMAQYQHWLTVPLAAIQAFAQLQIFRSAGVLPNLSAEAILPTVAMIASMTAGTMLLVWLGELITENGIGNGISVIIFGGIVANLPQILGQSFVASDQFAGLLVFAVLGVITVFAIVVFQEATRRIPVQYAKQMRGSRLMRPAGATHIPLRVNSAGMIPLIFAMSIMIFPGYISQWFATSETTWLATGAQFIGRVFDTTSPVYWILFFLLTVAFTFFYAMVIFQQQNLAENLQKYGGFIPGIRPGKPTSDYLNRVLYRITWAGALFLGIIAILPFLVQQATTIQAVQLSSTGLLIVVGVVLDTMKQLEAQLLMRRYEGFIK